MRKLILASLLLFACLEPGPGARPALDLPMPIAPTSTTECWYAYICFDACESDLDCAIECREAHPEGADQAGEALYKATRFGETAAQIACFTGAFG